MFTQNEENHREEALNAEGRGTCDHCGEIHPLADLMPVYINECICKGCKEAYQQEDEAACKLYGFEFLGDTDSGYCTACSGSGEGQYDGTRCYACHGTGVEK